MPPVARVGFVRLRSRVVWAICVTAVLLGGGSLCWFGALSRGEKVLPRFVVYIRPRPDNEQAFEVVVRSPAGGDSKVLCTLRNTWLGGLLWPLPGPLVPDAVGVLPSPTGDWLLAWGSKDDDQQHPREAVTEWFLVRRQDGTRTKIAESGVAHLWDGVAVVPSWASANVVLLDEATGTVRIDVRDLGRVEGWRELKPFAGPWHVIDRPGSEALQQLLRHAAAAGLTAECSAALRRLPATLAPEWNPEWTASREEWACLLGLGIPVLPEARGWMGPWVQASLSPGRLRLAVADSGVRKRLKHRDARLSEDVDGARLRVVEIRSKRQLWYYQVFPRALEDAEYPGGRWIPLADPPMPLWTGTSIEDLRWSADGRYLSFTLYDDPRYMPAVPTVHVMDTDTWQEVLLIPNAMDAFVLPARMARTEVPAATRGKR